MKIDFNTITDALKKRKVRWSEHSLEEKKADNLTISQIKESILSGEIIEQYLNDKPLPSCLIFGYSNDTPIHSVIVFNQKNGYIRIITVYIPDDIVFEEDLKTRRKK